MNDLETMKRAKSYIDMLANGIDPLTGETIHDDSVINNVRISRCLFYVSDVLKRAIDNGGEFGKKYIHALRPFSITPEQAEQITVSEDPVPVSVFAKQINEVIDEDVKPLSAVTITNWLCENGYLAEEISDGKKRRVSTTKGVSIGIETVDSVSRDGIPYKKNIYTEQAQRFIIKNLDNISGNTPI